MRINDIKSASAAVRPNGAGDEKRADIESSKLFKRQLTELSRENHRQYISGLIDEITAQGEKISKKADIEELQKYRQLIIKLLQENASNSFSFDKSDKFDAKGRHKVFTMIKTVNKKLDELTAEVLKNESENIRIIDLMDDIRGILVDLFL